MTKPSIIDLGLQAKSAMVMGIGGGGDIIQGIPVVNLLRKLGVENIYTVTVVDYTDAERIHAERTNKTEADSGSIYWQIDVQASIAYAAWQFRQRDAKVTYDAWHYIDRIEGHQLQLTNADQSRTFAGIYLHESRLYILEATVPPGAPPPGLFQQSLSFLDEEGNRVRYDSIYSNRLPPR